MSPEQFDPNKELSDKETEAIIDENISAKINENKKLIQEMTRMRTADGLLDIAESKLPNADPILMDVPDKNREYSTESYSYIIEAWKRIKAMPNGEEKNRLQKRADEIYGKYLDIAQSNLGRHL